jgi:hypothetical protein
LPTALPALLDVTVTKSSPTDTKSSLENHAPAVVGGLLLLAILSNLPLIAAALPALAASLVLDLATNNK